MVLFCGGRDFTDAAAVEKVWQMLRPRRVVHGGARGADTLIHLCAEAAGVPCAVYPAQWAMHGRSAGPRRNQQMLDYEKVDLVVAFPGGRGTADMVSRALKQGVPVVRWESGRLEVMACQ